MLPLSFFFFYERWSILLQTLYGTLTIKGNIAESPCKFEAGGDSVSINMPTVPTTVFEGKAKYSTYDDAVGVTSSMLKISCPKEVAHVKLRSLPTIK